MKILVLDHDPKRRSSLSSTLRKTKLSFQATSMLKLSSGLQLLEEEGVAHAPIAICMDRFDPTLKTIEKIRSENKVVPIIVAQQDLEGVQISKIIDAGADDAVALPILSEELASRIHSISRRSIGFRHNEVDLGWITVDLSSQPPHIGRDPISLTKKEVTILQVLAVNANRLVSRKAVYNALYAFSESLPFEKGLDVHIFNIRKKLEKASPGKGVMLETVTGQGFILHSM